MRGVSALEGDRGEDRRSPAYQEVVFGGEKGAGAAPKAGPGLHNLEKAKEMEKNGEPALNTFHTTGWYHAPDDKWKWVLSDQQASLKPDAFIKYTTGDPNVSKEDVPWKFNDKATWRVRSDKPLTLGDVLDHPDLYAAYPQLKSTKVELLPGNSETPEAVADYSPYHNRIRLSETSDQKELLSSLLHEIQHGVQNQEGFGTGAAPSEYYPENFVGGMNNPITKAYNAVFKKVQDAGADPWNIRFVIEARMAGEPIGPYTEKEYNEQIKKLSPELLREFTQASYNYAPIKQIKKEAFEHYQRTAGETESRQVQYQYDTGDWTTLPTQLPGFEPGENQIVRQRVGDRGTIINPGKTYQSAKPSALDAGTDYGAGPDDLSQGDIVIRPNARDRRGDIQNPIWTGPRPARFDYPVSPLTNPFLTPEYGYQSSPTNPVLEDRPSQIPPGWSETRGEHSRYRSPKMSDSTPDRHYPSQQVPDFTDKYNTYLNPDQEAQYQTWLQDHTLSSGRDMSKDQFDYDLRGAYLNKAEQADNGHYPDEYKKPNHPGFSNSSIYHGADGYEGGSWWVSDPDNPAQWSYEPSSSTLKMHGESGVKSYLGRDNPNPPVQLILPKPPTTYDYSPVEHDPFVEHRDDQNPSLSYEFVPVEHDPFENRNKIIQPLIMPAVQPSALGGGSWIDLAADAQGNQSPMAEPASLSQIAPPVNTVQPGGP